MTSTELQTIPDMKTQITFGKKALHELKLLVKMRPNPVMINGKRYLEFCDWQMLGSFFGITAWIVETKEITRPKPIEDTNLVLNETIGFHARAEARKDGVAISAAEAECMFEEPNWKGKQRFTVLSMAETRACARVLRQVLQWIVKLPDEQTKMEFGDEAAEEVQGNL